VQLVFAVPLDALLQGRLGRHLVLAMPELVHLNYRAIKNISQLTTIAAPTNSTKQ
jgi:hypothetical protein